MMRSLFAPLSCATIVSKAGAHDPSQTLRHICGYHSLQFSARLACRPAARRCRTGPCQAAHSGPWARHLSAGTLLWGQPWASELAHSQTPRRSIWANPCGRRSRPLARSLADLTHTKTRSLVLATERFYADVTQAPMRWWSNRGETTCGQHIYWQGQPFWRSPPAATRPLSKAPSARLPVRAQRSCWAETRSQVRQAGLRPIFCTVRPTLANATTQAHRFDLKNRATALETFGKGAAFRGAFSRFGRNQAHV